MNYLLFPLQIAATGSLQRSTGAEENLLALLRIMFRTPANGWPGSPKFGVRDLLGGLRAKGQSRPGLIRQINENLRDLGVDWAELKSIDAGAPDGAETEYALTLEYKGRGAEVQRIRC
jgi:hypothetical protein